MRGKYCSNLKRNSQHFELYLELEESTDENEQNIFSEDFFSYKRIKFKSKLEQSFLFLFSWSYFRNNIDAAIAAISNKDYDDNFRDLLLKTINLLWKPYDKPKPDVTGYLSIRIERKKVYFKQILYVVRNGVSPTIGGNSLNDFWIWLPKFNDGMYDKKTINKLRVGFEKEILKNWDKFLNVFDSKFANFNRGKLKVNWKRFFSHEINLLR